MSASDIPDSVMATLAKLAEMTVERGCTPGEAATAASHLERLLERWQLSRFDVKAKTYGEDVTEKMTAVESRWGASQWIIDLAGACAFPHDCRYWWITNTVAKMVYLTFVGHKSDAAVASYLFDTLSPLLREMGSRDGKKLGRKGSRLRSFIRQYVSAAAAEIHQRLQGERDKVRAEQNDSRALVVVKTDAVKVFIEAKHPKLRTDNKDRSAQNYDGMAAFAGAKAGREVELKKGITNAERPAALPEK